MNNRMSKTSSMNCTNISWYRSIKEQLVRQNPWLNKNKKKRKRMCMSQKNQINKKCTRISKNSKKSKNNKSKKSSKNSKKRSRLMTVMTKSMLNRLSSGIGYHNKRIAPKRHLKSFLYTKQMSNLKFPCRKSQEHILLLPRKLMNITQRSR